MMPTERGKNCAVGLRSAKVSEVEILKVVARADKQKVFCSPLPHLRLVSRSTLLSNETAQDVAQSRDGNRLSGKIQIENPPRLFVYQRAKLCDCSNLCRAHWWA